MRKLQMFSTILMVLVVAFVLAVRSGHAQKDQSLLAVEKDKEFKALKQRAALLTEKLRSPDPKESRTAKTEWQRLVADLDAWSRKYKAATKTETGPISAAPIGGAKHRCPPIMEDGPGYFCVLISEGPNKCVYRCYRY